MQKLINDNSYWEKNGILKRYKFNPILEHNKEHFWESKMVYNCAVVQIKGIIYIIYRAFGNDHISRLGLAWTEDGVNIIGRLRFPIFEPKEAYESPSEFNYQARLREKGGCEDPRVTIIGNKIYMIYTAFSELCQIALASINVEVFTELVKNSVNVSDHFEEKQRKEWNNTWIRHGLVFSDNINKKIFSRNACIFPVEIENKTIAYGLIHRTGKGPVKITYSQNPLGSWKNGEVLISPTQPWEQERMGICTPPIKTVYGLLFFYHGVEGLKNNGRIYRLGYFFAKFYQDNDEKIKIKVAKTENPVLTPERKYEVESEWLEPCNVYAVFSCGAVAFGDKQILGDNDEILIYYSGGDTRICVAKAKVANLLSKVPW